LTILGWLNKTGQKNERQKNGVKIYTTKIECDGKDLVANIFLSSIFLSSIFGFLN